MQTINVGTTPNDGTGDPLRTAMTKVNSNFTELDARAGSFWITTPGTDPNGAITATRPAVAYDDAGALWVKTNSGSNNTGWVKLLG